MYEEHRSRLNPDELARHIEEMRLRIPLGGRSGDPERDLAPLMVFLASDASRFISGQIISVNGAMDSVR
jgi:3-oxoacyl-[acyl-carrier protein] reductase